jgi:ABC-type branched-subunit amino acid transport system ATPase component
MLALANVVAGYGAITVLDGVSLRLGQGEVLAVLGANGSGKSTVLKTAIGLTRVTGGSISLAGRDITRLPAHRRAAEGLGYVPQTSNVFADLSVLDNLRMGAFLRPAALAAESERLFALFPVLAERRRERAGNLSGGERRMLSIALTLLLQPKLLLLDEPSSDLSPVMVDQVFQAIERIHRERAIPILLVEQNVAKALALASRVCVLVRGREALDAPAASIDRAQLHALFLDGAVRTAR